MKKELSPKIQTKELKLVELVSHPMGKKLLDLKKDLN